MQVLFSRGLVTKYLLTILSSISIEDCKHECAGRATCDIVFYERRLQVCELHTKTATRPENIVSVPGSVIVTDIEPVETCDVSEVNACPKHECPHPETIGYTLHRGNMFGVNSSVQVRLPNLSTPRTVTCLNTGEWKLNPEPEYYPDCHDCTDIQKRGHMETGVYFVNETFSFVCSFDVSGDAWLTFQRRLDGSVEFYRNWTEYVTGFGNMEGEFWFGLEKLYQIVSSGQYELRVDLGLFNGSRYHAQYSTFDIAGASDNYRLTAHGYTGTAGDSLRSHDGMQFSTFDNDNDKHAGEKNCAESYVGAWWYNECHSANLNGKYFPTGDKTDAYAKYMSWFSLTGHWYSVKTTEMKIRRIG